MNEPNITEQRLDQLGQDLRRQPSIVDHVMAEIDQVDVSPTPRHRPSKWRALTLFVTAACLLLAIGVWLSQPTTLYAQTVAALKKVDTIHVTGWTSRVIRKWPLQKPTKESEVNRHECEAWYWHDDRTPRSHETFGPVIQTRHGKQLKEYQSDADLLFVAEFTEKDYVDRFSTLADYLRVLKDEGAAHEELGTRSESDKTLRGVRFQRHGSTEEFWFDAATNLPATYSAKRPGKAGQSVGFELKFAYDQKVPDAIVSYQPPETKNVRHGGQNPNTRLVWLRHVQGFEQATNEKMVVIPRRGQQTFSLQYLTKTPDGKHLVIPLDHDQYFPLTVKNFVNLRVSTAHGDRAFQTWRVPKDLLEIEFPRSDLVCNQDTPWQDWVQFALSQIGLEYVDVTEQRTFWIAKHDGRKLKDWRDVAPPEPYIMRGDKVKRGVVKPGVGHRSRPATMQLLLEDFNRLQNLDFNAIHPIIVDETGLPKPPELDRDKYSSWDEFHQAVNYSQYYVASDSPWFVGPKSSDMARSWYEQELGLTFTEEKRPLTIHVVRRKR